MLWFRNTWSWSPSTRNPYILPPDKPTLEQTGSAIHATHGNFGDRWLHWDNSARALYCENETNNQRLYGDGGHTGYFKDGINSYVVSGTQEAINPEQRGTRAAVCFSQNLPGGGTCEMKVRLTNVQAPRPFESFETVFSKRKKEADQFYHDLQHRIKNDDEKLVQRQAPADLLWSKQFYYYDVPEWLVGDECQPAPPERRRSGRNADWMHLNNADIISMPDKWEYPWYAASRLVPELSAGFGAPCVSME